MNTAKPVKPRLRRYTVEEYDRLTSRNVFRDARVELIEGRIIELPPQREPHAVGVMLGVEAMRRVFATGFTLRPQMPLRLGKRSKPEPDIAVVAGEPRDSLQTGPPTSAALVIEVSDTTLRYDRGKKASLYAKEGFTDYWIVNLVSRQVEVHREPMADPAHKWGFRYSSIQIFKAGETVSPLAAPQSSLPVNDLLP